MTLKPFRRSIFGEQLPNLQGIADRPVDVLRAQAREQDPGRLPAGAKRDEALKPEIRRVWEEHFRGYGARKVWKRLNWEATDLYEWVDWFNNRLLLESIGGIPPVELEQAYYE